MTIETKEKNYMVSVRITVTHKLPFGKSVNHSTTERIGARASNLIAAVKLVDKEFAKYSGFEYEITGAEENGLASQLLARQKEALELAIANQHRDSLGRYAGNAAICNAAGQATAAYNYGLAQEQNQASALQIANIASQAQQVQHLAHQQQQ